MPVRNIWPARIVFNICYDYKLWLVTISCPNTMNPTPNGLDIWYPLRLRPCCHLATLPVPCSENYRHHSRQTIRKCFPTAVLPVSLHARLTDVHHITLSAVIVTVDSDPTVKCNSTVFRKYTKKVESLELTNTTAHDTTSHLLIRGRIPQLRTSRQPAPSSSSSTYLPPDDDEDGEMSPKVASATITTDSIITRATF